jgi:hypothetical protein
MIPSARHACALKALDRGAHSDLAHRVHLATNLHHPAVALYVRNRASGQFRGQRNEQFHSFADAQCVAGLEANPAFRSIYSLTLVRQRNCFQEFRGSAWHAGLRTRTDGCKFLRDDVESHGYCVGLAGNKRRSLLNMESSSETLNFGFARRHFWKGNLRIAPGELRVNNS